MIQFSPAALAEIDRLRLRQATPEAYLRIALQSKGCQGISYSLTFISQPPTQDYLVQGSIAIEAESLETLRGLSVDYAEDLMGGNFRFDNPQAIQTCGCGISFRST
jgi:iron-sulfur cluster assembly protein